MCSLINPQKTSEMKRLWNYFHGNTPRKGAPFNRGSYGTIKHLLSNYEKDPRYQRAYRLREITIIPMINPDGAMHDIKGRRYKCGVKT